MQRPESISGRLLELMRTVGPIVVEDINDSMLGPILWGSVYIIGEDGVIDWEWDAEKASQRVVSGPVYKIRDGGVQWCDGDKGVYSR
jgi:hypothetical protein